MNSGDWYLFGFIVGHFSALVIQFTGLIPGITLIIIFGILSLILQNNEKKVKEKNE